MSKYDKLQNLRAALSGPLGYWQRQWVMGADRRTRGRMTEGNDVRFGERTAEQLAAMARGDLCRHGQPAPHRFNDNGYWYSECAGPENKEG